PYLLSLPTKPIAGLVGSWFIYYLTANVSVLTRRTCITIYATSNSPHCYTSHTINQNSSYFFESTISSKDAANAG
ncbi:hypothetical protein MM716_37225, partial [Klebsiella pneumoniae]|nr:hypothetical protein [Klebsiella pneumoniae]